MTEDDAMNFEGSIYSLVLENDYKSPMPLAVCILELYVLHPASKAFIEGNIKIK